MLAADVGGTKTDLALLPFVSPGKVRAPRVVENFLSADFPSFAAMLSEFMGRHPRKPIAAAGVGFAGPVAKGRGAGSNVPWPVDAATLARHLSLPSVALMNDLVAMGHGVPALKPRDLEPIQAGVPARDGNGCILAAGTGLGETTLARSPEGYLPIASEGGHADFAPRTDLEVEVFRALRARFGRVSYEHVLSGPGLVNVAEILHAGSSDRASWSRHREASHASSLPGVISRSALEGSCEACSRALDCFAGIYGAEAGNLALRSMATAGVYLGGGIAPKVLPILKGETFRRAFRDKAPHVDLLTRIPVWVITSPHVALLGAARFATLGRAPT